MSLFRVACFLPAFAGLMLLNPLAAAQTFFYVGPAGGDFFDENNWNDSPDGTGSIPAGDPLMDSTSNAIALDLVIDGVAVDAAGQVDFGDGSLSLLNGAAFSVSGSGNQLDINAASSFTLVDSTLVVDDDMFFEGMVSLTGGSITSVADDIEFQDNLASLTIAGTTVDAFDNLIFDAQLGSIVGATFVTQDRFAIRNTTDGATTELVIVDSLIDIQGGAGDLDDVFDTNNSNGAILVLDGTTTLSGNQIDDGSALVLDGASVATLNTGAGAVDAGNGGSITVTSFDAELILVNESTNDVRSAIFNGLTGLSYADDPSTWNVSNWDGVAPVSLQIVPEPGAAALVGFGVACLTAGRHRRRVA